MVRLSARLGILLCLTVAMVTASARAGGDGGKCTIATKPETDVGKAADR